jgi:beta-ketoacyl ACP synthase
MVSEAEQRAKARGDNLLGRLMGTCITSDGYHIVAPDPDPDDDRAGYATTRAKGCARLTHGDIDHVNARATGTRIGDLAEAKAIGNTVDNHRSAVYAPKSTLGHSVGAVEALLTVLALRHGVTPANVEPAHLDRDS